MKATSVVFLIAGYETLSNLLAYVAYELAINTECQRRLQQELDDIFPEEVCFPALGCCLDLDLVCGCSTSNLAFIYVIQVDLSYDKLSSLAYLEMVISETLRMYPIAAL